MTMHDDQRSMQQLRVSQRQDRFVRGIDLTGGGFSLDFGWSIVGFFSPSRLVLWMQLRVAAAGAGAAIRSASNGPAPVLSDVTGRVEGGEENGDGSGGVRWQWWQWWVVDVVSMRCWRCGGAGAGAAAGIFSLSVSLSVSIVRGGWVM